MSRIGRLPIIIPENVNISSSGSEMTVKGKFGTLQIIIPETIQIENENGILSVSLKNKTRNLSSLHGLYRTLINNMVIGVSEQFQVTLVLKGVGYRAAVHRREWVHALLRGSVCRLSAGRLSAAVHESRCRAGRGPDSGRPA